MLNPKPKLGFPSSGPPISPVSLFWKKKKTWKSANPKCDPHKSIHCFTFLFQTQKGRYFHCWEPVYIEVISGVYRMLRKEAGLMCTDRVLSITMFKGSYIQS